MPSNYTKNLTSILEMLWNIEKDLNLVSYNETEKKIYYIYRAHQRVYLSKQNSAHKGYASFLSFDRF